MGHISADSQILYPLAGLHGRIVRKFLESFSMAVEWNLGNSPSFLFSTDTNCNNVPLHLRPLTKSSDLIGGSEKFHAHCNSSRIQTSRPYMFRNGVSRIA